MKKALLAILSLSILAASLSSQSKNATLLSNWRPKSGSANDVWGFEDPKTGKPYCVLGTTSGTYILDVSNPRFPVSRGYFAGSLSNWSNSTWRDMKYWKGYVYVVTEANGAAVQVLDCTNPDKPKFKTTYTPSGVTWTRGTHNIAIDLGTGLLYCCGTNGGMHILDPDTSPGNLRYVGTWRTPYIHDLAIQDGYAHVSYIANWAYGILDVRNPRAIKEVGRASMRSCHNNWPTADNAYSVTTSEFTAGTVGIWDVRNRQKPTLISSYRANPRTSPRAIPHNAYILDYVIHVAYYTEGYRAVDMSDPKKPVEVGYYDTWRGSSTGFNGNWGVYPYARSGIQYVTDRSSGLYLVKPAATAKRYGKGTKGSNGKVPHAHLKGAGYVGNASFGVGVRDARPRSVAILALGGKPSSATVGGLEILIDLANPAPLLIIAPTDANGVATSNIPLPNDNNLVGAQVNYQAFVVDKGASIFDLASSEGLEFTLFRN